MHEMLLSGNLNKNGVVVCHRDDGTADNRVGTSEIPGQITVVS